MTEAVSFEIIDMDSGNTIAGFDDIEAARAAFYAMPDSRDLVLVAFDSAGLAVDTLL